MSDKAAVSMVRCESFKYDAAAIRSSIERCLQPLGGLNAFVAKGDRVLLKPNFVSAKPVSFACNTHPEFIFAVCRMIRDLGAVPVIGESPALGSSKAAAKKMGMLPALKQEGFEIIDFTDAEKVVSEQGHCRLKLAKEIHDYDKIINLAKLKSHGQMRMTCCVKNLFGFVVGRHKAGLHMSIGHREDWFSAMILEVADLVKPTLHLVDGVVALQKGGPIVGEPLELGLIAAGTNGIAVDRAIYELLKVDPESVPVQAEAVRQKRFGCEMKDIQLIANANELSEFPPFEAKEHLFPISFTPWHIFKGWMKQLKRRMTQP